MLHGIGRKLRGLHKHYSEAVESVSGDLTGGQWENSADYSIYPWWKGNYGILPYLWPTS
jgi:hypothetical protein